MKKVISQMLSRKRFQREYYFYDRPIHAFFFIQGMLAMALFCKRITPQENLSLLELNKTLLEENKYSDPAYDE